MFTLDFLLGFVVCMHYTTVWLEDLVIHLSFNWASCNGLLEGSLYIDDRLNGELLSPSGPLSVLPRDRSREYCLDVAKSALFVVLSVLVQLGYTIGLKKSVLWPSTAVEYLGFIIDSEKQSFLIPRRKIESFASFRETILAYKSQIPLSTMQRFQGKCVSLLLAVSAAKLFIRETSKAIASAEMRGLVTLNEFQREEVTYWHFLDDWRQSLPWREEKLYRISLSMDASNYGGALSVTSSQSFSRIA